MVRKQLKLNLRHLGNQSVDLLLEDDDMGEESNIFLGGFVILIIIGVWLLSWGAGRIISTLVSQ